VAYSPTAHIVSVITMDHSSGRQNDDTTVDLDITACMSNGTLTTVCDEWKNILSGRIGLDLGGGTIVAGSLIRVRVDSFMTGGDIYLLPYTDANSVSTTNEINGGAIAADTWIEWTLTQAFIDDLWVDGSGYAYVRMASDGTSKPKVSEAESDLTIDTSNHYNETGIGTQRTPEHVEFTVTATDTYTPASTAYDETGLTATVNLTATITDLAYGDLSNAIVDTYRFRNDDGNETGATWQAAQVISVDQRTGGSIGLEGRAFRLRFSVKQTGNKGVRLTLGQYELFYRINGGAWTVSESGEGAWATYGFAEGTFTSTEQLTDTGTFVAGKWVSEDGSSLAGLPLLEVGERTELEFTISLVSNSIPGVDVGDTVDFTVGHGLSNSFVQVGQQASTTALVTYDETGLSANLELSATATDTADFADSTTVDVNLSSAVTDVLLTLIEPVSATASSTWSTFTADLAHDNNDSTYWWSSGFGYDQWIYFDFGDSKRALPTKIVIRQDDALDYVETLDIEGSNDGTGWTAVNTGISMASGVNTIDSGLGTTEYRYWRMSGAGARAYWWKFHEIDFYGALRSAYSESVVATVNLSVTATDTYTPGSTAYDETGLSVSVELQATETDAFATSDSVTVNVDLSVTGSDIAALADSTQADVEFSVTSNDGFAAVSTGLATTVEFSVTSNDDLSVGDSVTVNLELSATGTESANFADSVSVDVEFSVSATDTYQGANAYNETGLSVSVDLSASSVDSWATQDSLTASLELSATGSDSLAATDSGTATVNLSVTASDGLAYQDSLTVTVELVVLPTDTLTGVDSIAANLTVAVTGTDNATFTESTSVDVEFSVSATDDLTTPSNQYDETGLTVSVELTSTATSVATYADPTSVDLELSVTSTDSQPFSDSVTATVNLSVTATELLALTESTTTNLSLAGTATDMGSFLDGGVVMVNLLTAGADTLYATDSGVANLELSTSRSDSWWSTAIDSSRGLGGTAERVGVGAAVSAVVPGLTTTAGQMGVSTVSSESGETQDDTELGRTE